MPIRFTIDHDKRLIEAQVEGEVTLKDFQDFLDATVVQDSIRYRKLVDGRGSSPLFSDDDVMMLGARLAAYSGLRIAWSARLHRAVRGGRRAGKAGDQPRQTG